MSSLVIKRPHQEIKAAISLPASKSICNRALILQKILGNNQCTIINSSEADDSMIMQHALKQTGGTVNIKNAGTCMRFLTAYYASTPGIDVVLHGDERMHKRPLGVLVDALKTLGADIDHIHETGFAPLRIKGRSLDGGVVSVDASVSSQFTSALMLVGPLFKNGLVITRNEAVVSKPYVSMTASLMQQCGFDVTLSGDIVVKPLVRPVPETHVIIDVEPDWSAAGYWYMIAALNKEYLIELNRLKSLSIQGDAVLVDLMRSFGVATAFNHRGAILSPIPGSGSAVPGNSYTFDMADYPDLVPALAVLMCALNVESRFINVAHLEAKESRRLTALSAELQKCGFNCWHTGRELFTRPADPAAISAPESGFDTYNDHRMAMAFAPLALIFDEVKINDPGVVEKSYPAYWKDLAAAGFELKEI
ncbi:MAG: 3-phosphoshikimate 1-carboxyvinyltransferase [Bacteroidota bacterium]